MRKLVLALAAASCFGFAAPAIAMPAAGSATAIKSVSSDIVPVWHRRGHVVRKKVVVRHRWHRPRCRTVTTKTYRHGRVIIKKVRRCR